MKIALVLLCLLASQLGLAQPVRRLPIRRPPANATPSGAISTRGSRRRSPPRCARTGPRSARSTPSSRPATARCRQLLAGRRWRTSIAPVARTAFNRCEGVRPGFAVTRRHLVRHGATLGAGLGYGIARERFVWDVSADLPLAIAAPMNAAGRPTARSWPALSLELRGGDQVVGLRRRARHRAAHRDPPRRHRPADVPRRPRRRRRPGLASGSDRDPARRLAVRGAVPAARGHALDPPGQRRRRCPRTGPPTA